MTVDATADFLDQQQYTTSGVHKYEMIFGSGYISTGGSESTAKLFDRFPLSHGARVLDIGCGIGGGDQYMNERFGASVLGIDLAKSCIEMANSRYAGNDQMEFRLADALTEPFAKNSFDVVYSRDAILHISSKKALFKRLLDATKSGGCLVMTDYCCGSRNVWDQEFTDYVAARGYTLLTPMEYGTLLSECGWSVKVSEDASTWFLEILHAELARAQEMKEQYLKTIDHSEFDDLIEGWRSKIRRVSSGMQKWGIFYAVKP